MKKFNEIGFLKELNSYGYDFKTLNDVKAIYTKDKVLIPVILKYLDNVEAVNYREYFVRCLTKRGYTEATEKLLSEFKISDDSGYKWAVGNAIYEIRDVRFIDEYISIVGDAKHGKARQMIVLLLGFLKSEQAKEVLIKVLHEDHVTAHAITSLGRYKDKSIIPHLEYFFDDENKKKWIDRIKQLKEERSYDPDYAYIEVKGAWKHIEREAQKAIKRLSKA